jgi:hypothetical protein
LGQSLAALWTNVFIKSWSKPSIPKTSDLDIDFAVVNPLPDAGLRNLGEATVGVSEFWSHLGILVSERLWGYLLYGSIYGIRRED